MTVLIDIEDASWNRIGDLHSLVENAVDAAMSVVGREIRDVELSIVLADDAAVAEMNSKWRGKPRPTNVLSFPASCPAGLPAGTPRPMGDIIVAHGVVAREAGEQGKSIENHLSHLVIHAMLHLIGYDHDNDTSAETMEALEIAAMRLIGRPDPYNDTAPAGGAA